MHEDLHAVALEEVGGGEGRESRPGGPVPRVLELLWAPLEEEEEAPRREPRHGGPRAKIGPPPPGGRVEIGPTLYNYPSKIIRGDPPQRRCGAPPPSSKTP